MSMHMIQASFDAASLARWAARLGISTQDQGYLVHAGLRAAFGQDAPQPFTILPRKESGNGPSDGRFLNVLGYAAVDHRVLLDTARALAEPLLFTSLELGGIDSKTMPEILPSGQHFGFRVHACPVKRSRAKNKQNGDGPVRSRVEERDVFLWLARQDKSQLLDREQVYLDWLKAELARFEAARLVRGEMSQFRFFSPARKNEVGRPTNNGGRRPEATFEGELEVGDPAGMVQLLARGVGRHRAFGFGMVLLRPKRPI